MRGTVHEGGGNFTGRTAWSEVHSLILSLPPRRRESRERIPRRSCSKSVYWIAGFRHKTPWERKEGGRGEGRKEKDEEPMRKQ
jgi:hypothetical protein